MTPVSGRARGGDLAVALGDDLVDPGAQRAVLERGQHAADRLDPAELLPAGDREVVGELLDREGPARGVGDLGDVGLLDQQGRGVARDPAAERVRAGPAGRRTAAPSPRRRRPTPAANAATQVRSMFTQGSYFVIIGREVTACSTICRWSAEAPLSSSIRAQSRRTARSLAIVTNCSSVAASRNSTSPAASSTSTPADARAREVVRADGEHVAELLHVGGAEVVHRGAVDDEGAAAELTGEARRLGNPRWSRSAAPSTPSRSHAAAAPTGSTPRLVPGASVVPSASSAKARAAPSGSEGASSTTGGDVEQHALRARSPGRRRRRRRPPPGPAAR